MYDVQKTQQHNLLDQKASMIVLVRTFKTVYTRGFSIVFIKVSFFSKDACKPGYWSPFGTPECSLCPIGSYSNHFGALKCKECPFSKSTDAEGANDESFCESKFDFYFNFFVNRDLLN